MRKILKWATYAIAALLLIMLINTFTKTSLQIAEKWKGTAETNTDALRRLAEAVQIPTVSRDGEQTAREDSAFEKLYRFLSASFPECFKQGEPVRFHKSAVLINIKGLDASLAPALFLAHLDVVPVDTSDLQKWRYQPFSGLLAKDTLYGRGTLDDKVIAMAMLEALEKMLKSGKKPKRSIMLALGDDEETGGKKGAAALADYLKKKSISAEFIADEGLGVTEGIVPGVTKPTAIIGLSEKGFCSVKFQVEATGGHSSMPGGKTASGLLAEALYKVENAAMKQQFSEPMKLFLETGAPEMSFPYRFLFSNLWATAPLVKKVMSADPKTAASIQTVKSITIMHAGVQDNVVPNSAWAIVNFRILPGETSQTVMEFVRKTINDPNVKLSFHGDITEPGNVSSTQSSGYKLIEKAVKQTFNETLVIPGQVLAGTDCKHYYAISKNIYRFVPLRLNNTNIPGIHGINERIAAANYYECIQYYKNLFAML